jgi:hypothetical protein
LADPPTVRIPAQAALAVDVGSYGRFLLNAGRQICLGLLLDDSLNDEEAYNGATKREDEQRDQQRRPHPQPVHQPHPPMHSGNINFRGRTYNQYRE